MTIEGIEGFVRDGATWALYNQFKFMDYQEERIGEGGDFAVDMQTQTIEFTGQRGSIRGRFEALASFAPGPRSMLWTWAMGHETDEGRRLRDWGQANGVGWLTQPELPISTAAQGDELVNQVRQTVHDVAAAISAISGLAPYYSAPTGQGNYILGFIHLDDYPAPRIDQALPRLLGAAFQNQPGVDHRPGAQRFAQLAKFQYHWADGGLVMNDPQTGGAVQLSFTEQGWLNGLKASLGSPEQR